LGPAAATGAVFFAKAEWQTRYHAFYFPFTCAVFFLLCSLSESEAGAPWVVTLFVGIFPLLYFLVLCGVGVRKK